jgi:DNA modification methylase
MKGIEEFVNQVFCGDCREIMRQMPPESVDLVMFSPPYWGLRNYGEDTETVWGDGWRGQLGLEPDFRMYIEHLMEIGNLVWRVLKKTGSWYLNLGDTYFEKQLLGIPWRIALALQEKGWILRNDIIWHKPNAMPSSVKDRLTCTYEHIFFFVKSRRYYYDLDSIREPHKTKFGYQYPERLTKHDLGRVGNYSYPDPLHTKEYHPLGKNPGDIFRVKTADEEAFKEVLRSWGTDKYGEYHGQALKDYQSVGAQNPSEVKRRIIEGFKKHPFQGKNPGDVFRDKTANEEVFKVGGMRLPPEPEEEGAFHPLGKNPGDFWEITTKPFKDAHFAVYPPEICVRPILSSCPPDGIVLDPMCGSGTTCAVAKALGRNYIGIDINPKYVEMARKRVARVVSPLAPITKLKEAMEAVR